MIVLLTHYSIYQVRLRTYSKAKLNLVEMCIHEHLAQEKRGQNTYLPPACHTLSRKEKIELCQYLAGIKVPSGCSSNIQRLALMKDLKLNLMNVIH